MGVVWCGVVWWGGGVGGAGVGGGGRGEGLQNHTEPQPRNCLHACSPVDPSSAHWAWKPNHREQLADCHHVDGECAKTRQRSPTEPFKSSKASTKSRVGQKRQCAPTRRKKSLWEPQIHVSLEAGGGQKKDPSAASRESFRGSVASGLVAPVSADPDGTRISVGVSPTSLRSDTFRPETCLWRNQPHEQATSPDYLCRHPVANQIHNKSLANRHGKTYRADRERFANEAPQGPIVHGTETRDGPKTCDAGGGYLVLPSPPLEVRANCSRAKRFRRHHEPSPLPPPARSPKKGGAFRTLRGGVSRRSWNIETRGCPQRPKVATCEMHCFNVPSFRRKFPLLGMSPTLSTRVRCTSSKRLGSFSSRHRSKRAVAPKAANQHAQIWRMCVTMQRCDLMRRTRMTKAEIRRSTSVLNRPSAPFSTASVFPTNKAMILGNFHPTRTRCTHEPPLASAVPRPHSRATLQHLHKVGGVYLVRPIQNAAISFLTVTEHLHHLQEIVRDVQLLCIEGKEREVSSLRHPRGKGGSTNVLSVS